MTGVEEIQIRAMHAADIARVMEISEGLPEAPQWPAEVYAKAIDSVAKPARFALVAVLPATERVVGFAIAVCIPPEAELETIAVERGTQGHGVGSRLLAALAERLRGEWMAELNLEVRSSNARAVGFYRARGFRETGRRPRYYASPEEDAVLMSLDLGQEAG